MDDYLKEAKGLIWLAVGKEGPEDARHATEVATMFALMSMAESLAKLAKSLDRLSVDQHGALQVRAWTSNPYSE